MSLGSVTVGFSFRFLYRSRLVSRFKSDLRRRYDGLKELSPQPIIIIGSKLLAARSRSTLSRSKSFCCNCHCGPSLQVRNFSSRLISISNEMSSRSLCHATASFSPYSYSRSIHHDGHDISFQENSLTTDVQKFFTDVKCHVIFQDDNLLALSKPNGLSVYGGSDDDLSLKGKLTHLAEEFQCPGLDIGLSLKSYLSGVVVLTKNEMAAKELKKCAQTANMQKECYMTFLAVTVGIPQCRQDEDIELFIERNFLHSREMKPAVQVVGGYTVTFRKLETLKSAVSDNKISKKGQKSLRNEGALIKVSYNVKVLAENRDTQSALVQIKVNKYKWDACEVFLSHFLSPILGDKVYSSRTHHVMGVPVPNTLQAAIPGIQRLPVKLSKALNQQKSGLKLDALPLFLHLHKVTLRKFPNAMSPSFDIAAHPPETFIETLKLLGLYKKSPLAVKLIS